MSSLEVGNRSMSTIKDFSIESARFGSKTLRNNLQNSLKPSNKFHLRLSLSLNNQLQEQQIFLNHGNSKAIKIKSIWTPSHKFHADYFPFSHIKIPKSNSQSLCGWMNYSENFTLKSFRSSGRRLFEGKRLLVQLKNYYKITLDFLPHPLN